MPASFSHNLLQDGSLRVKVESSLVPAVDAWLPRYLPSAPGAEPRQQAVITVADDHAVPPADLRPPILSLGSATAHDVQPSTIHLSGPGTVGRIDLRGLRAELGPHESRPEDGLAGEDGPGRDATAAGIFSMLTLSSAFLLGRIGRTLLHSGAVVAPDGRAWLLVGDTHSGKTTTVLTLIRAGWPYLSDDHVVLSADENGGMEVEGWPRTFHVDEGWFGGEVTGRREDLPLDELRGAIFQRQGTLGGVIFPEVRPHAPTGSAAVSAGAALEKIIRQSPWLLADREVAPSLLPLLKTVAALPAFSLTLGLDSYGDPDRLVAALPVEAIEEPATRRWRP